MPGKEIKEEELEKVSGGVIYNGVEYNYEYGCKPVCCPKCKSYTRLMYLKNQQYFSWSDLVYYCSNCQNVWK